MTAREAQQNRTAENKEKFLAEFARCGRAVQSARAVGITPKTHYHWFEHDAEYRERCEEARQAYCESLEAEADRRAVEGVDKPAGWYRGVAGGTVREYSDSLLRDRLRAEMPDKYRERIDVQMKGALARIDYEQLPDAIIDRLASGENPMAVLAGMIEAGTPLPMLPPGKKPNDP